MDPQEAARKAKAKAEAAQAKADKLTEASAHQSKRAFDAYGRFAGGQPLLSGHHSYRSARRAKNRADAASDRAIDTYKAAQQAQRDAKWAKAKADARSEIADTIATQSRPWQPSDFQVGDIVTVRVFETSTSTYRVKRVNKKTLTLDGGGGGWDDPKREYDRVLSRTRDGHTITNPEQETDTPMTNSTETATIHNPTSLSDYDWLEFVALVWKVRNEGSYRYAVENWPPQFESPQMQAIAADDGKLLDFYRDNLEKVHAWADTVGGERAVDLHNDHIDEARQRERDACLWGVRCTDGYVVHEPSEEERDAFVARLLADTYPKKRVPAVLLHRNVPGGEWTESPLKA